MFRAERAGENLGHYADAGQAALAYRKAAPPEKKWTVEYTVDISLQEEIAKTHWGYATKFMHLHGNVAGIGQMYMHRLVWDLCGGQSPEPGQRIDHIDRDPTNNTASNLRLTTHRGNLLNNGSDCVRFRASRKGVGGIWEVRLRDGDSWWSRRYEDEDTARLVAKHRKSYMIEREVVAYVSCP